VRTEKRAPRHRALTAGRDARAFQNVRDRGASDAMSEPVVVARCPGTGIRHSRADAASRSTDGPPCGTVLDAISVRTTDSTRQAAAVFMERYYKKCHSRFAVKPPAPTTRVPSDYARRLRRIRRTLRLTQTQLATTIGAAGKAVIYQWESEKRRPSPVFWKAIEGLFQKK
jgi:DNA-binding XRE family transcriptional regulator